MGSESSWPTMLVMKMDGAEDEVSASQNETRRKRTAKVKDLVDAGEEDREEDAEEPHAEGVDRHEGVVDRADCGSNLWIGRFTA